MRQVTCICDRCGQVIEGTSYYQYRTYAYDIDPVDDGRQSVSTFTHNLGEAFSPKKMLCKNCMTEIDNFINNKEIKSE